MPRPSRFRAKARQFVQSGGRSSAAREGMCYTGAMPDIQSIAAAAPEMYDTLKGLEWSLWSETMKTAACPACGAIRSNGHKKKCEIRRVLDKIEAPQEVLAG